MNKGTQQQDVIDPETFVRMKLPKAPRLSPMKAPNLDEMTPLALPPPAITGLYIQSINDLSGVFDTKIAIVED